jgi:hypothetical protein
MPSPDADDLPAIYLSPACCGADERTWCVEPVPCPDCDAPPVKYVRAAAGDTDALVRRLRMSGYYAGDIFDQAADEIERLRATLKASEGYMLNAKIDLETNTRKRTAIQTIEGGLNVVRAALTPTTDETKHAAGS